MITIPSPALLWILGATFAALVTGSVIRFVSLRNADEKLRRKRFASLRTWWMVALAVAAALLAGRVGVCTLLAAVGILAFREYVTMLGLHESERPAIFAACLIVLINYLLILFNRADAFLIFVPLASLATLAVVQLVQGKAKGYIRTTGALFWGLIVLGYGMSHAAYLFILPASSTGPAGPAGWFLFLLILTEADDIFQAIIGRTFGANKRHLIAPVVSPNKTWEGLLGGMLVTMALAVLLAPWLTTLKNTPGPLALSEAWQPWVGPALIGILITVAGYFGDINMSAVKRDSGVKDSSKMLPGMGGLNDRVDSLTFTAPAFVYFLIWWMT
jgi:phosphatidate cytidylyltransferase